VGVHRTGRHAPSDGRPAGPAQERQGEQGRPDEAVRDRPSSYAHDVRYTLTPSGRATLAGLGVDADRLPPRRPAVRYCVDWSEHQHHLAGGRGAVLMARLFALDWVRWGPSPRVVLLTDAGAHGLEQSLGVVVTD
jgi:hypothetical protein